MHWRSISSNACVAIVPNKNDNLGKIEKVKTNKTHTFQRHQIHKIPVIILKTYTIMLFIPMHTYLKFKLRLLMLTKQLYHCNIEIP